MDYLALCATAAERLPMNERALQIAGVTVRQRIAGAALAQATLPAQAHLLNDEKPPGPAITLHLWDGAATGVWPPRRPFTPDDYRRYGQRGHRDAGRAGGDGDPGIIRRDHWAERLRRVHTAHRFTTAMQADVIHVLHAGRVVESGTHADLPAGA